MTSECGIESEKIFAVGELVWPFGRRPKANSFLNLSTSEKIFQLELSESRSTSLISFHSIESHGKMLTVRRFSSFLRSFLSTLEEWFRRARSTPFVAVRTSINTTKSLPSAVICFLPFVGWRVKTPKKFRAKKEFVKMFVFSKFYF